MIENRFRLQRSPRLLISAAGLVLLALVALGIFRVGGEPDIEIKPGMPAIGKQTPFKIEISEPRRGLAHVTVEFLQGDDSVVLADKVYPLSSQFFPWSAKTERDNLAVEAGKQILSSLTAGTAVIRVTAERASTWLRHPDSRVEEITMPVRLTPPSLQVTSTQIYVTQGGCETVTYRVGEFAVRDGVRAGIWWFPGYPLPGGDKQDRFALFAVPFDMEERDVRLIVEDDAGNIAEREFIDKFFPGQFKSDTIHINDAFLDKVVPEILSQSPEIKDQGDPLKNYLAINNDLRKENDKTLKQLARKSKPAFLWNKAFLAMPNAKVTALFGERRTYLYSERVIDHQNHLGYDLAVTKQAPVPAANSGIVVFAGYFGIYGNTVVIDHGYGLQSIYGHLSSMAVAEGQEVSIGDIIGRTGETGLAGGDHLHFCTLLQGLPVNPVEWWDSHWIRDRISKKLGSVFSFSPQ